MAELLRECKADSKYEAAAGVQKVLELLKQADIVGDGEAFLRTTADERVHRPRSAASRECSQPQLSTCSRARVK